MKFLTFLLMFITGLSAESLLGNMFIDLKDLDLSPSQHHQLTNIMKNHHGSLKEWYAKSRDNNEKIIQKFSNSSLSKDSSDLSDSINLATERTKMEQDFLIAVYGILNNEQRAMLGRKINSNVAVQRFSIDAPNMEFIYIERQVPLSGREFRRGENVNLFD